MHYRESMHYRFRFSIQKSVEPYQLKKKLNALVRGSHPVDKVHAIEILLEVLHHYCK